MLGAIGGATVVAMYLSKDGVRTGVLVFWLLFAGVATLHTMGVPL